MTPRVKICGITRLDDALAAADAGADALGFVLWPGSPRHIAPEAAAAIVARLPAFVTSVALFVNPTPAEVDTAIDVAAFDLLQFHGDETAAFCAAFRRPWIKALRAAPGVDLLPSIAPFSQARGVLIDAHVPGAWGGTGVALDWSALPRELPLPLVLAGGLDPDNVAAAVRTVRPWAVDVSSGVERAKGIKDHAKVETFIRRVRNAAE
ncbi:MAG: phosphoribosylanthranilate isomerase [Burkholderiales bacterium]|jgi:phosphoribosylanthranilate isomerase|nr:phosphoribosylanthranilate isomerase [Burkholderiales bacterium]